MNNNLYDLIVNKKYHHSFRQTADVDLASQYSSLNLSPIERMTRRFEFLCDREIPHILKNEKISFLRTTANIPDIFTDSEWDAIKKEHFIHELGYHSNLCANYEKILKNGLLFYYDKVDIYAKRGIDALLNLVDRYSAEAESIGEVELAARLKKVPRYGADTLLEAMQSFRILNFALWLEGNYHNTIGRLDKYMGPYMEKDITEGTLTKEAAYDLIWEFFLSFNRDSDLYVGVQQGDNGQSLMLGALDTPSGFNQFSELCLQASNDLKLIDPKINVRVNSNTPLSIFTKCSELTKAGLGFPQYSNDDVVIPGLMDLGYSKEDADNYTVAACWEFIIPAVAEDIPNIAALSFPKLVDICLHRDLKSCRSMDEFLKCIEKELHLECDKLTNIKDVWFVPSPFLQMMMDYDYEQPKYQNYGIHGVGLSTAVDSLITISNYVFGDGSVSADELIKAVDTNFLFAPELLHRLRFETPKLGCGYEEANTYLSSLLDMFASDLKKRKNDKKGIWRPGTGSAMFYLWSADDLGASPDGRQKGEPFAANYSISLFAKPDGPFSILDSMTSPNLQKVINGGPLTLEFHQSIFSTQEAVSQVGQFVKRFIDLGGHQLQLNAVNAETLKDAKKHPENYPHLIVRIWGWSAYFVELDEAYQDHVIRRQEYVL